MPHAYVFIISSSDFLLPDVHFHFHFQFLNGQHSMQPRMRNSNLLHRMADRGPFSLTTCYCCGGQKRSIFAAFAGHEAARKMPYEPLWKSSATARNTPEPLQIARSSRVRSPRGTRSLLAGSPQQIPPGARGCAARPGKLDRARSRLYRGQILQVNMRLKALAEIYTMHSFALLCRALESH